MKRQIRILGVDDAPFCFYDRNVLLVGVIMRGGEYIEGVLKKEITIDGCDATDILIDMIQRTKHRKQLKAVMIDGVTVGGFNIVDRRMVFEKTHLPVITVTRDKPAYTKIQSALRKHFSDWKKRWDLITQEHVHEIETSHNPVFVTCTGMDIGEAKEIIKLSTIRGVIPEPLRVAHIIASGMIRGESCGKA